MQIDSKIDIEIPALLEKFVFQMSGREIYSLIQAANASSNTSKDVPSKLCTGIHALAEHLGCCESTIYMLKREGVLDKAVISHIGKKIVFDVEKAREAAENFRKNKKAE